MSEKLGKGGAGSQEYNPKDGKYSSSESQLPDNVQALQVNSVAAKALYQKILAKKTASNVQPTSKKQEKNIADMTDEEVASELSEIMPKLYNGSLNSISMKTNLNDSIQDSRLRLSITRRLIFLSENFPLIGFNGDAKIPFTIRRVGDTTIGWNSTNDSKATTEIGLNSFAYGTNGFKKIANAAKNEAVQGWSNPCSNDEQYTQYSLSHEWGHAIINMFRATHKQLMASNMSIALAVQDIARKTNDKYDLHKDSTGYVRMYPFVDGQLNGKYYSEWLAETFASLVCGKPNEGARALELWLKENIYKNGK